MSTQLRKRHPFTYAACRFAEGRMDTTTAIGLIARDREFIAEATLAGAEFSTVVDAARRVVSEVWLPRLVASRIGRA